MVRLSKRLAAVAACVRPGAAVIDVGTDHGLIPVWLAQTGTATRIYATDVNPGPLRHAALLLEETETQDLITLRVCDGLSGFGPGDADTVMISGMGGENIAEILDAAPWVKNGVTLILQPQTRGELLRRRLYETGFDIFAERIVSDAGRLYQVLCAEGGAACAYTPAELYTGRFALVRADPLLPALLENLTARFQKAAPYDESAAALLWDFSRMKGELL